MHRSHLLLLLRRMLTRSFLCNDHPIPFQLHRFHRTLTYSANKWSVPVSIPRCRHRKHRCSSLCRCRSIESVPNVTSHAAVSIHSRFEEIQLEIVSWLCFFSDHCWATVSGSAVSRSIWQTTCQFDESLYLMLIQSNKGPRFEPSRIRFMFLSSCAFSFVRTSPKLTLRLL